MRGRRLSAGTAAATAENRLFVTDGGTETDLIFHRGIELPFFAAFPLLEDAATGSPCAAITTTIWPSRANTMQDW